jgi:hypothetical protein
VADLTKFYAALEKKRRADEAAIEKKMADKGKDLAVGLEDTEGDDYAGLPEYQRKLDEFLKERVTLELSYETWCGKSKIKKDDKVEGNKIACPIPGHTDNDPSAWFNTEKQLWFCGTCQEGGDKYHIAGWAMGLNPRSREDFPKLKLAMAETFGFEVARMGKEKVAIVPEEAEEPKKEDPEPDKKVVSLVQDTEEQEVLIVPELPEWDAIFPKDTFLDEYIKLTTTDTAPEAFHLFCGLTAIGLAIGRDAMLYDHPAVGANLFTCFIAVSGAGKSRALRPMMHLLREALPFKEKDPGTKGVKTVKDPGSPEVLIQIFERELKLDEDDPTSPKMRFPTKGLITFGEMSSISAKSKRVGTDLKERLMQFCDLDDLISNTTITGGHREAVEPFASCMTTSQPDTIRRQVGSGDIDSGFANRWIFVVGSAKPPRPIGDPIPSMTPATLPLQRIMAWAATRSSYVQLSEEAKEVYTTFFYNVITPDKDISAQNEGLLVRIDLTFKKLMLLLAANKHEEEISSDTVRSTIKLYNYLKACYRFMGERVGISDRSDVAEKILRKLIDADKKGLTRREVILALPRKYRNIEVVNQALEDLGKSGMAYEVRPVPTGKKGRPAGPRYFAL